MRMHKRPREDTVTRQPLQHEKGEGSRETSPASTLTLNYQPPELWENKLLLFKQKNQNKKTKQKTKNSMGDGTYIGAAIFGKCNLPYLGL